MNVRSGLELKLKSGQGFRFRQTREKTSFGDHETAKTSFREHFPENASFGDHLVLVLQRARENRSRLVE